jgi:hypothetical protein
MAWIVVTVSVCIHQVRRRKGKNDEVSNNKAAGMSVREEQVSLQLE